MKALVTGATGIIGANLTRELLAQGHDVAVLVRPSSDCSALDGLDVRRIQGDVLKPGTVRNAMDGAEIVFHAAAIFVYSGHTQDALDRVAVDGTQNVLLAAADAGVKRLVFTSSSVVFGSSSRPEVRDETSLFDDPHPPKYVISKVRQHHAAFNLAERLNVEVLAACPTVSIGAHDYRLSTSNAIIASYLNDPWRSSFLGGCNLVSARDVARGHILIAERGKSGESYLLGSENLMWQELHRRISQLCSLSGPWITLNHTAAYLAAAAAQLQARWSNRLVTSSLDQARMVGRYFWYQHAKAHKLGYAPVPADHALVAALQWLIKTQHVNRFVRDSISLKTPAVPPAKTMTAKVF
jgi:dihydroflavonol-4-reductase